MGEGKIMVFGLFGKKGTKEKALEKGKKALSRGMAADARIYFEEVLEEEPDNSEALAGLKASAGALVAWNLEEARMSADHDPVKARECAELALELAGGFEELVASAKEVLSSLGKAPAPKVKEDKKPKRMFEPSCGCASPCGDDSDCGDDHEMTDEELFEFFMGTASEEECAAMEFMGESFRRGFVALQQGDGVAARKLLNKAEAEEEATVGISFAFGLLEEMQGNVKKADKRFTEALERDDGFLPALNHLVTSLMEQKRPGDAADLLADYYEEREPDDEMQVTIASVNLAAGRLEAAHETLAPLAQTSMSNPSVAVTWARILQAEGDAEGAITAYQAASAHLHDSIDVMVPMGELMIEQGGRWAEHAVKVYKHCYRIDPQNGWYHLLGTARAYAARGWNDEAQNMVDLASDELPDHPDAKKAWESVARQLGA
jgi:tetratricopeptide (TPR) repeat protein